MERGLLGLRLLMRAVNNHSQESGVPHCTPSVIIYDFRRKEGLFGWLYNRRKKLSWFRLLDIL